MILFNIIPGPNLFKSEGCLLYPVYKVLFYSPTSYLLDRFSVAANMASTVSTVLTLEVLIQQ